MEISRFLGNCVIDMRKIFDPVYQMESMLELDKLQKERATKFLIGLDKIPYKTLISELERARKRWDSLEKRAKSDRLVGMVAAGMSWEYVPKIEALEKVIELKKKINRLDKEAKYGMVYKFFKKYPDLYKPISAANFLGN